MARVLIVDDALFMRVMLTNMVEELGHEVVGCGGNGLEGFEKYKELKPDIVTLDITMPDVDGLEGLKMITSYDKQAKVIMCSAMGQQFMVVEAIQHGAKDFLVKPFNKERIEEAFNKLLS